MKPELGQLGRAKQFESLELKYTTKSGNACRLFDRDPDKYNVTQVAVRS